VEYSQRSHVLPYLYKHPFVNDPASILILLSMPNYGALTSVCQQRSKDALCAPQVTLRISLDLLFIGRVRSGKCPFVIGRSEYGRLCDSTTYMRMRHISANADNILHESLLTGNAGAPENSQYSMPKWLIVFVGRESDCSPER
jgi:hypothetical protein